MRSMMAGMNCIAMAECEDKRSRSPLLRLVHSPTGYQDVQETRRCIACAIINAGTERGQPTKIRSVISARSGTPEA